MNKDLVFYVVTSALALAVGAFVFWGPNTTLRKRRVPIVGLKNLGYTCFLNALLQALASCPIFIEWLELKEELDSVSRSVVNILKILSTEPDPNCGTLESFSPKEVITSLGRNGWTILPGEQDAHELFHHLILMIEEESNKNSCKVLGCLSDALIPPTQMPPNIIASSQSLPISFKPNSESIDGGNHQKKSVQQSVPSASSPVALNLNGDISSSSIGNNKSDRGDSALFFTSSRCEINNNPRPSPFTGYLTSQTHCTECGFKSVLRYDKFDSLSLHLPPLEIGRTHHTLAQLLERFVKTEMVNGVSCDGCNKSVPPEGPTVKAAALKSLSIGKLPRCLCIHIPRTLIRDNGEPYKRSDYVDFPEYLAMDPYTQNNMMRTVKCKKQVDAETAVVEEERNEISKNCIKQIDKLKIDFVNFRKMNHIYRIKAVIVHRGALEGGHFVTYRRGPLKSHLRHRLNQSHHSHGERRWYLTSDANVRDATLSEALQSPAYMLFYEKCASDLLSVSVN